MLPTFVESVRLRGEENYNSEPEGTMSGNTGHNYYCACGSGKKYEDCCGAPQGEVTSVRTKDLSVFELTPGLADVLSASLDAAYQEYFTAACSGTSTKEAERRIAVIPEEKRYLTRVLDSLDGAFSDFGLRPRCWIYPTCKTANLSPSNSILSSVFCNSKCCLLRLRITLRSFRQQEDILSPAIP